MPDLSCFCDLHHSSWQHQIPSPLSEARDRALHGSWSGSLTTEPQQEVLNFIDLTFPIFTILLSYPYSIFIGLPNSSLRSPEWGTRSEVFPANPAGAFKKTEKSVNQSSVVSFLSISCWYFQGSKEDSSRRMCLFFLATRSLRFHTFCSFLLFSSKATRGFLPPVWQKILSLLLSLSPPPPLPLPFSFSLLRTCAVAHLALARLDEKKIFFLRWNESTAETSEMLLSRAASPHNPPQLCGKVKQRLLWEKKKKKERKWGKSVISYKGGAILNLGIWEEYRLIHNISGSMQMAMPKGQRTLGNKHSGQPPSPAVFIFITT